MGDDNPSHQIKKKNQDARNSDDFDEITILTIALVVRQRWKFVASIVTVFVVTALIIGFVSTPVYRAEALVVPLPTNVDEGLLSGGAGGGGLGGLAGLAGLAGISLGGNDGGVGQNLALLQSRILITGFVETAGIKKELFYRNWDEVTQKWRTSPFAKFKSSLKSLISGPSAASAGFDPDTGPSPEKVHKTFRDILSINLDEKTGLVTLGIGWHDPEAAALWAREFIRYANDRIREDGIVEARGKLEFLRTQLRETQVTEVRDAATALTENELKKLMISNVRQEYAFKVIDPPTAPELREWPKRGLLVILGVFLGGASGIACALFWNYLDKQRTTLERR